MEDWRRDYNEVRPMRDRQQGAGIAVEWLIGARRLEPTPGKFQLGLA
jgi:hypothetical protein